MARDLLSAWTIFDRPKDHPDGYIARRFIIGSGRVIPTEDTITSNDIDLLREKFQNEGFVCFVRAKGDDAKVVETWM